jgi:cell division protein FtsW (lipid II flippase)
MKWGKNKLKKITDERLKLQNLKNIRVLFLFQNAGIIGILAYDFITSGLDGMTDNPLWFLFIMTTVVSAYLSMSISVDHEEERHPPKKSLLIAVVIMTIISVLLGIIASLPDGSDMTDGVIVGGVIFICGLIPAIYVYSIRKKRKPK